MGLMSKIRDRGTKVALASTIGLSLLGSGCAEMVGGFLSGMGSYEGSQVEAAAIRDAARMKQGNNSRFNPKEFSTAFNYWLDDNGDGIAQVPELKGASLSHDLSMEKQVTFSTLVNSRQGEFLHFYLYDPSLKIVAIREGLLIDKPNYLGYVPISSDNLSKAGANGLCSVNWRIGRSPKFTGSEPIIDSYYVNFANSGISRR